MEKKEEEEPKQNTSGRKRSYSDHNMVKLAYRFNKKKLEESKENKNIFSKDISEFISIINELSVSLPNFFDYLKKYFSSLQMKISLLIQQINSIKNNVNIIISDENIKNIKEENEKDEEFNLLFNNFDSINNLELFIKKKKEELITLLNDSIIKDINNKYNSFKLEKNKLFIRLQNIINDIIKIKGNIDLVIDKSKNIEDLEMQKNNSDDLKVLQNFFTSFEKEYNSVLSELKNLNQNTLTFINEDLNKYFDLYLKINEEIKEEINRIMIGNKISCEDDNKFLVDKIKNSNKKMQKDIKQYILLNNDNRINESMKSKSLLSRIGDAMLIAPEYFILFNNFDNDDEDKTKKHEEEDNYNKNDLLILKNVFNDLEREKVLSDESLNNLFGILGNVSDKRKYINLCLHFVKYINENRKLVYNNIENFIFGNNMLNIICHNCPFNKISSENNSNEEFEKNYKFYQIMDNIIRIGNDSLIGNQYMCTLLKNIDILKDIKTFKYSFKSHLISEIKNSLNIIKKNINPVQNVIDLFNNKIYSSLNKYDFIEEIGLDNYIESYKNLSLNEKISFNLNEFLKIVHNCLKKYIIYMANYNVEYSTMLKFIKSLNDYFPFLKDNFVKFYLIFYKSSFNSIKKYLFRAKIEDIKILKKIKYSKENNKKEENFDSNAIEIKKKKLILKNILPFLDIKNKIDLIHLNKKLKMRQYIYKNILISNQLSIEKRIEIWKIILNCEKIENNKFREILKDSKESEDFKVIMDDTKGTFLLNKDKEKTQNIVKNILCCFISKNNYNIKYCQGMNFMVAFLYDLTNNEELTFNLFKSLIENTELKTIYDKKFELLHCYFYVLNRLISLYLPLLKQKFDDIQMNIDCFVSPYFLTLFSHVFILNNNCKKFMIFIFENFMLSGWKIIFNSILAILKHNEKEIINIKEEGELLNYVIQNLKKSDVFLDDNFEIFLKIYNNFDINNNIINRLKEEYKLENELNKEIKSKI